MRRRVECLVEQKGNELSILLEELEELGGEELDKREEDILNVSGLGLHILLEFVFLLFIVGAPHCFLELVGVVRYIGHDAQISAFLKSNGDAFSLDKRADESFHKLEVIL